VDAKTLQVLEYPKIQERLAAHCAFSASMALARQLQPSRDFDAVCLRLQETREARLLLAASETTVGGAHDVRPQVDLARRGGVLEPADLLDLKSTLISARELRKLLEKRTLDYPRLSALAQELPAPQGLIEAISQAVSDRGEILDSASPKLASTRAQVRVAHDRLTARLQKLVTDSKTAPMLQEAIVTQRDGRYVIPLRAEFKGQLKAIVHDQSASGATLFVEPLAVVELNNQYRELQLAERDEERRILAELSDQVGALADEIIPGIEALAELDLAFAKAKYAEELRASEPVLHEIDAGQPAVCRLFQARHPLLDPAAVVAIDFDPPPDSRAVVITGPNTGGKTVALKTVGLLALMAQSGLHLPVQSGSELSLFEAVYADIGDEQSIEQSLSTFSGHVTNIVRILARADTRSLVILDELGAGTDPQEGAALARAILSYLLGRGATTLVTTHHPELKAFAHVTPGVVNASAEFDLETLRPTYHLTIGLPGRSNALAIAERLGLAEEILSAARAEIHPDELRAESLLDEIHRQRDLARQSRDAAELARQEAEALRAELAARLEAIEEERLAVLEQARLQAQAGVEELRGEMQELRRLLQRARQPLEALKEVDESIQALEEAVEKPAERKRRLPHADSRGPLRLGEPVRVRTLNAQGVVTALGESEAEVQVGSLRVRARLSDLERGAAQADTDDRPHTKVSRPPPAVSRPGMEISLRGMIVEEALERLERYLEQAYLDGLPFVRIIHGKGTGKLRQAVRHRLTGHEFVASFEEAGSKEGGEGVTVAILRSG
jgi:DNA mismatch repair protein MutS2